MSDDAAELITAITEHHGLAWLAMTLGMSERTLDQIRLGQVRATPDTLAKLCKIA
jgi:hypothetical protein